MDKSVDSIGSCSLDVDAETTDFSDTSGSLNFPTPVSLNDLPGDTFGTDLRGRIVVKTNESKLIEPTVMAESKTVTGHIGNLSKTNTKQEDNFEIKPSYLNIACCVNGYSNLTTYDSKVRQDINKSREVSPIRPSSNSLQYCKKSDSLLPPVLLALPNAVEKLEMPVFIKGQNNNNHNANGLEIYEEKVDSVQPASFIQQRVERLYGPGALAQGFYSPRKQHDVHVGNGIGKSTENNQSISELSRKFKEFSPSKDYNLKSLKSTNRDENSTKSKIVQSVHNNNIDLPVLRHLSQEFRAQLPTISPKKVQNCVLEEKNSNLGVDDSRKTEVGLNDTDVVDKVVKSKSSELMPPISTKVNTADDKTAHTPATIVKDGQYFLTLLKAEQKRILILAAESEKYTDALSSNPDIGDDILGLLRAFTGKARLLVNQKLKQFEGLCHNNMNRSGEDKFPTTDDDLQGFWDMVYLQIDHVDTIYKDIEHLKNNDWKKEPPLLESIAGTQKNSPKPVKGLGLPGKSVRNKPELSPAAAAAALKREAQRKQLMEMKRKKKMEMASNDIVATAVEKSPFEDSKSIQIEITEQNSQIDV